LDYYKQQAGLKKLDLAFRGLVVKSCRKFARGLFSVFDDPTMTGETTSLQVCDIVYIRPAKIPISFVKECSGGYGKYIRPSVREALSNCTDDIYVVSAEPAQLLDAVFRAANIREAIMDVYCTRFKIKDDIIAGFEKLGLHAGMRGKYLGLMEVASKPYDKIYTLGDSAADAGFELHRAERLVPCTFSSAPEELKASVLSRNGKLVNSVEEFLQLN